MNNIITNEKIKYLIKLKDKKFRLEEKKFLVEGKHLIEEAKEAGLLLEVYTTTKEFDGILIKEEQMKKISQTNTPSNVLGVCKMVFKVELSDKILILDDISDPTNLGTILRSAKAFKFDTIIASNDTVDFYNDKVIRGSQGAIFKINLIKGDLKQKILELKKQGYFIYGTDVKGGFDVKKHQEHKKSALILGNETRGVNDDIKKLADQNLYIKLDNMESLNVSVAGSILMYEL